MALFKGIKKLSKKKYNELLNAGLLDPNTFYVTEELTNINIKNMTDGLTLTEFKGIVELSESQYQQLITEGYLKIGDETIVYDEGTIYVTPEDELENRINNVETTVTELTTDVMRALKTPISAPNETKIVAVDNTNSQEMLSIGNGLVVENGELKSTGGTEIIDNLTSSSISAGLSANQGRVLDNKISSLNTLVESKANQSSLDTTNQNISQIQESLTEITPDVMRALKRPMSIPTETKLVAVDNTNSQEMLGIGTGLKLLNGNIDLNNVQVGAATLNTEYIEDGTIVYAKISNLVFVYMNNIRFKQGLTDLGVQTIASNLPRNDGGLGNIDTYLVTNISSHANVRISFVGGATDITFGYPDVPSSTDGYTGMFMYTSSEV